jgi:hypothetical protein
MEQNHNIKYDKFKPVEINNEEHMLDFVPAPIGTDAILTADVYIKIRACFSLYHFSFWQTIYISRWRDLYSLLFAGRPAYLSAFPRPPDDLSETIRQPSLRHYSPLSAPGRFPKSTSGDGEIKPCSNDICCG